MDRIKMGRHIEAGFNLHARLACYWLGQCRRAGYSLIGSSLFKSIKSIEPIHNLISEAPCKCCAGTCVLGQASELP